MLTNVDKLLNSVNTSTERWKRQGFQRRFSVTDLHGVEYSATMDIGIPAQFYTAISYDFDRLSHWWFKIIINPVEIKRGITEGKGITPDNSLSFNGDSTYNGGSISYGGNTLSEDTLQSILKYSKEYGVLPSGAISQMYLESSWGNSIVGKSDNNWSGIKYTGETRPSGVKVTQGSLSTEGDYYSKYKSVDDYLKDHFYLIAVQTAGNNQKMYQVQGKNTLEDFTKGLFRVGGALYDYAGVGYNAYLTTIQSGRSGINTSNSNILDKLDEQLVTGKTQSDTSDKPLDTEDKKETSTKKAEKTQEALAKIDALQGQTVGSGECYGLVALYSKLLGGVGLGGEVTKITHLIGSGLSAKDIGTDYDWTSVGWTVKVPQSKSDIKVGAIYNVKAYASYPVTEFHGHTGVIKGIEGDNVIVLEQNIEEQRFVVESVYNIDNLLPNLQTLVYPPEIADGYGIKNSDGNISYGYTVPFPDDISVYIDNIDFTPMFKAQFNGEWIKDYAIYPNDKPNEGYDIMLSALGLTKEQQDIIYTSGEHLSLIHI